MGIDFDDPCYFFQMIEEIKTGFAWDGSEWSAWIELGQNEDQRMGTLDLVILIEGDQAAGDHIW